MASEKITAIIEELKGLTVLELSELVHAVEDEFGVSAAAAVAVAGPAADGGAALAGDLSRCDESHILWDAALSAGDTVFCEQWKTAPYRIITFKAIPHKAVRRALCGIAL